MRRLGTALIVMCVLAVPTSSWAWIYVDASFGVNASLTKVADDTYDFSYNMLGWQNAIPPSSFPVDFSQNGYSYEFSPYQVAQTGVLGGFGVPTDQSGWGAITGNGSYFVPNPSGAFRMNQVPEGLFSLSATQDIQLEVYDAYGFRVSRELVGTIQGSTHLFGALPTGIGETTEWIVTPEPPTWVLGAILLVAFPLFGGGFLVRRR
jgi:hypothetical protein